MSYSDLGTVVTIVAFIYAIYLGTRKRKLLKKIEQEQQLIDKIDGYAKQTGYKALLRDCFHLFSYTLSLVFIALGLTTFLPTIITNQPFIAWLNQIAGAMYLASGVLLFQLFMVLSKVTNPKESVGKLKESIEQKKEKISEL